MSSVSSTHPRPAMAPLESRRSGLVGCHGGPRRYYSRPMIPSLDFRPAWWLPGGHAQTVGARLLRPSRGVQLERERVELPDGDFVDLDWVRRARDVPALDGGPLVLVLHGLEGSAQSSYAMEIYRVLLPLGVAAVGMNFRSCSGELNRLPRSYHSGDTGDLAHVLALLARRYPGRPIGAAGFSLGANVLLKYLGERGNGAGSVRSGAPEPAGGGEATPSVATTIDAAAAISVPFDLAEGADHLERGFGRIYRWYLVRRLMRKVRAKIHLLRGSLDLDRVFGARTFREFDEAATAVLHGFAGADDYYRRSSSGPYLDRVSVPTLIIHAEDDPFLPRGAIPRAVARANPHLTVHVTRRGGHVGFVSGSVMSPVFWAERAAGRFLAARLSAKTPGEG